MELLNLLTMTAIPSIVKASHLAHMLVWTHLGPKHRA